MRAPFFSRIVRGSHSLFLLYNYAQCDLLAGLDECGCEFFGGADWPHHGVCGEVGDDDNTVIETDTIGRAVLSGDVSRGLLVEYVGDGCVGDIERVVTFDIEVIGALDAGAYIRRTGASRKRGVRVVEQIGGGEGEDTDDADQDHGDALFELQFAPAAYQGQNTQGKGDDAECPDVHLERGEPDGVVLVGPDIASSGDDFFQI